MSTQDTTGCEGSNKDFDFGTALYYLKQGKAVAREGWNGKKMYLWLNKGAYDAIGVDGRALPGKITHIEGIAEHLFDVGDKGIYTRLPNINMRAATGSTVTGWLASQTDMLAEDWCVVENTPTPVAAT